MSMKKLGVIALSLIFLAIFVTVSAAKNPLKQPRRAKTVLFKIKEKVTADKLELLNSTLNSKGIKIKKKIKNLKTNIGTYSDKGMTEEEVAAALMATGAVAYAEPDCPIPIHPG
jgi:hypothetical protein